MITALPDVNLLIALAWPNHQHHLTARSWFMEEGQADWATCPMTQAGFVRISSNPVIIEDTASPLVAKELLTHLTARPGHRFWPDDLDFSQTGALPGSLFQGHRQVTDAYLVLLAQAHNGRLVTLDRALANAVAGTELESAVVMLHSLY